MPTIKSVMTAFPYAIAIDRSASQARRMMAEHGIHHLPVMDGERLVGVVTKREIERVLDVARRGEGTNDPRLDQVTLTRALVVDLTASLDRVLTEMAEKHFETTLVVKDRKLAGIFTRSDACRWFGRLLRDLFPAGDGEDAA
ncbi:MAG: CBS domain-containing protein [Acidobacteriota bacterium]|nr:MAG: CBS domain-containing protein [Acidobacteriota bacterium]